MDRNVSYQKGFLPYALAALLIGLLHHLSFIAGYPIGIRDLKIKINVLICSGRIYEACSFEACVTDITIEQLALIERSVSEVSTVKKDIGEVALLQGSPTEVDQPNSCCNLREVHPRSWRSRAFCWRD